MILNEKDNEKLYKNLEKIEEWIKEKQTQVKEEIEIELNTKKYTIKLYLNNENCRIFIGNDCYYYLVGSSYKEKMITDDEFATRYIIDLIFNWQYIKERILENITEQKNILRKIREFKI